MLSKEKLKDIAEKAIGTLHYVYRVKQIGSQNNYEVLLYDQINGQVVANLYIYEGNMLGSLEVKFVPERSSKTDREVLRMINSQLFDYFDKQLEPKYYIKLLNDHYGYLTLDEDKKSWHVSSLNIAKVSHLKTTFTADEINKISMSKEFSYVDLWSAAEEVEEDEQ